LPSSVPTWYVLVGDRRVVRVEEGDAPPEVVERVVGALDLQALRSLAPDVIAMRGDGRERYRGAYVEDEGPPRRLRLATREEVRVTLALPPGWAYADPRAADCGGETLVLLASGSSVDPCADAEGRARAAATRPVVALLDVHASATPYYEMETLLGDTATVRRVLPHWLDEWSIDVPPRAVRAPNTPAAVEVGLSWPGTAVVGRLRFFVRGRRIFAVAALSSPGEAPAAGRTMDALMESLAVEELMPAPPERSVY
jgi:hypothetical protein